MGLPLIPSNSCPMALSTSDTAVATCAVVKTGKKKIVSHCGAKADEGMMLRELGP